MTGIMDFFQRYELELLVAAIIVAILLLLCCCCICVYVRRRRTKGGSAWRTETDAETGGETERLIGVEDEENLPEERKTLSEPQESEGLEEVKAPEPKEDSPAPKAKEQPAPAAELPMARLTLPYVSTGTGKSLADLRDRLEADVQEMFGTFERTDDEELEGEDEGPVIEENSSWIFDIPMADTPENRESLLGLATWLRDAAELHTLQLRYPDGEEVNLDEDD